MFIDALVETILSVFTSYLSKGTEEFAKEVGKETFEKAKELVQAVRMKFARVPESSRVLTKFEVAPSQYHSLVFDLLKKELTEDSEFAAQLSRQIETTTPQLHIVQKMKAGKNIIGLDADEMIRGKVSVEQDLAKADGVYGVKIGKIGNDPPGS